MENNTEHGDLQILQETVFNERLVTHPKLGKIRLRMPTLEIQRKIDAVGRAKKKYLKETKDTITDEQGNITRVPAYKSREQLAKEYSELGWWTDSEKKKLTELTEQHVQLLTELEVLGFESDAAIFLGFREVFDKIGELCKDDKGEVPEVVLDTLATITSPGVPIKPSDTAIIRDNSSTTEIDDLLEHLDNLHKQYNAYIKLAQTYTELVSLQSQQNQLFSDSWQDQLQYYLRLAQVFYCTEKEDGSKIWSSLDNIESEQDLDLIRWVFGELNAFWQGLSEETREKMSKYAFTNPRSTGNSSSEGSPAPQESSPDGELPVKTEINSSEAMVIKEPLQTVTSS